MRVLLRLCSCVVLLTAGITSAAGDAELRIYFGFTLVEGQFTTPIELNIPSEGVMFSGAIRLTQLPR